MAEGLVYHWHTPEGALQPQHVSGCFILLLDDSMESILACGSDIHATELAP
ncbi:hypothetical protein ACIBO6_28830 [Streptomyces luteogriseus]|uniref:hypothetical protein n=1 Tax=Streptomyces luteogriseus TaxID=68233 RepID=UPI0037A52C23